MTVLSSQLRLTSPLFALTVIVLAVASAAVTSPVTVCDLAAVCFLVLFLVLVDDIEPFDMSLEPLMLPVLPVLPMLPVPLSVPVAPVEPVCAAAKAAVARPIRPHRTHTEVLRMTI